MKQGFKSRGRATRPKSIYPLPKLAPVVRDGVSRALAQLNGQDVYNPIDCGVEVREDQPDRTQD